MNLGIWDLDLSERSANKYIRCACDREHATKHQTVVVGYGNLPGIAIDDFQNQNQTEAT